MAGLNTYALAALITASGAAGSVARAQEAGDHPLSDSTAQSEAHIRGYSYEMDNAHSRVTFKIRHLEVSNVRGTFHDVNASIHLDPTDITTLTTEAVISVASVDTDNERRDNDLRSDHFFDVAIYPEMKFASTEVTHVGADGTFKLHGQLTIRDVTRDVVFDAEMTGPIIHRGRERLGFVATTRIDRFDYGLKWDALTEAGGLVAGRNVDITLEVEANRPIE